MNQPTSNPYAATARNLDIGNSGEQELADRIPRLVAVIIDGLPFAVLGIIAAIVAPSLTTEGGSQGSIALVAILGLAMVAFGIYQLVLISRYAQTFGKRIMKVRVVRSDGIEQCGLGRYFWLRAVVPALIGGIPFVGWIFTLVDILMIFGENRRCLHDMIADTKVVKA
ncbi:MAG: RDD family protein [Pseudomonadota bacterium]